jgi:hypothetical protein
MPNLTRVCGKVVVNKLIQAFVERLFKKRGIPYNTNFLDFPGRGVDLNDRSPREKSDLHDADPELGDGRIHPRYLMNGQSQFKEGKGVIQSHLVPIVFFLG